MEFKTSISTVKNNETIVRNKKLTDLALEETFVNNIYFILTGKQATREIEKMLNIIFSLCLDHGFGAVSTFVSRVATSAKVSLQQSLIAALAAMGHAHGGACEDAAMWYQEQMNKNISTMEAVRIALEQGRKIPGYGHAIVAHDNRIDILIKEAKSLGIYSRHMHFAEEVSEEIKKQKGKEIPLNIDGCIAAVALDMDLPAYIATGFFIIGRLPGILAHIKEEIEQNNKLRRIAEEEIKYLG